MTFIGSFMREFLQDPFFNTFASPANDFFQQTSPFVSPTSHPSRHSPFNQGDAAFRTGPPHRRHASYQESPMGCNYFLPLEESKRNQSANRLRLTRSSDINSPSKCMKNRPKEHDVSTSSPVGTNQQRGKCQNDGRVRRRDPELIPAVTLNNSNIISNRHLPLPEPNSTLHPVQTGTSVTIIHQRPKHEVERSVPVTPKEFKEERESKRDYRPVGWDPVLAKQLEREIVLRHLKVGWDDIAGLHEAKAVLQESVILPLLIPDFFTGIRRPCKGILLVGPPGTGKTMLAKAVATESGSTFFNVSSSVLTSKYRGDSEKIVRLLFDMAKFYAPSTIFIDEVDALCSSRGTDSEHEASRRFKSELLIHMDGLETERLEDGKYVIVLAATNHPWDIDEAFRRRFEKRIYVPLPDEETRCKLLELCLKSLTIQNDIDIFDIATRMDGYSGADITNVCRNAALMSLRRQVTGLSTAEIKCIKREDFDLPVTAKDFEDTLNRCKSSVSKRDVKKFAKWMSEYESC